MTSNSGINYAGDTTSVIQPTAAALIALLQTYFPGTKIYDGHRPLGEKFWQGGQGQISFPCIMVETTDSGAIMVTTAKWDRSVNFTLFTYLTGNNPEALIQTQRLYADAFVKLFSNNALDDLLSGSPTFQYRVYGSNWYDSKIKAITLSPIFRWAEQNMFMRVIAFKLYVVTRLLE
jgi:hypothetical protein